MACEVAGVTRLAEIERRARRLRDRIEITFDDDEHPVSNELRECEFLAAIAWEAGGRRMRAAMREAGTAVSAYHAAGVLALRKGEPWT